MDGPADESEIRRDFETKNCVECMEYVIHIRIRDYIFPVYLLATFLTAVIAAVADCSLQFFKEVIIHFYHLRYTWEPTKKCDKNHFWSDSYDYYQWNSRERWNEYYKISEDK